MSVASARRASRAIDFTSALLVPSAILSSVPLFLIAAMSVGWTTRLIYSLSAGLLVLLGSWIVARIVHGFARLLDLLADQLEASMRLEERIASAVEQPRLQASRREESVDPALALRLKHLAEIRQAIRAGSWADAELLTQEFTDAHSDEPDALRVGMELAEAKNSAGQAIVSRIEAAREANDPDRVIELRDEARPLLEAEAMGELDRGLARWFMSLIQRRLRSGTVRADIAILAARVAQSLDGTTEGASLRASLPTLRRASGLCARCGQPYKGIAEACPTCLTGANGSMPSPPQPPAD
jgi:hypothetical protein